MAVATAEELQRRHGEELESPPYAEMHTAYKLRKALLLRRPALDAATRCAGPIWRSVAHRPARYAYTLQRRLNVCMEKQFVSGQVTRHRRIMCARHCGSCPRRCISLTSSPVSGRVGITDRRR